MAAPDLKSQLQAALGSTYTLETAKARRIADEPQLSPKSSRLIEDALHLASVAARENDQRLQRDADAAALALRRRVAQIERLRARLRQR